MGQPYEQRGGEVLVNTTTVGDQDDAKIAYLHDGRFVLVWRNASASAGDASGSSIRAQIFNADGSKAGAEFLVNTQTAFGQDEPDVTALAGGGFAVTWTDDGLSSFGDKGRVKAQVFDSAGVRIGAEIPVSSEPAGDQRTPSIASLADGGFAIFYYDPFADPSGPAGSADSIGIRGQLFNADGSRRGGEIDLATTTAGIQSAPSVAQLSDGRLVVAWTDESVEYNFDIRAQILNANGTRSDGEFLVSLETDYTHTEPSVAALAGGGFVIAWARNEGFGFLQTVRAQAYSANGARAGGEVQASESMTGTQTGVSAAGLSDGGFALVWNDRHGEDKVKAALFDAAGARNGAEFLIDDTTGRDQHPPAVARSADGFTVAWTDASTSGGDGSGLGVKVKRFVASPATSGDDVLTGTDGADTINGLAGADWLDGRGGDDELHGGAGNDQLFGGDGGDLLRGGDGDDLLDPGLGADRMEGNAGDDTFRFSEVAFTSGETPLGLVDGGSGFDTVDLRSISPYVLGTISTAPGAFSLGMFVGSQKFEIRDVERILLGSGSDTTSILSGRSFGLEIRAGGGDDSLNGDGDDKLYGEDGNDSFFVSGRFGRPPTSGLVDGGAGTDTFRANVAFSIDLQAQSATAGSASYTVIQVENVQLSVSSIRAVALGDGQANHLFVAAFNYDGIHGVTLDGRGGDDLIEGSLGADTLTGGTGNDHVDGRGGADLLNLQDGGDDIGIGGSGDDGFYLGSALTAADQVDGGEGKLDQLALQGAYAGLTFGAKNLVGIEQLVLLPGNDTRFGDTSGARYNYNLTTVDANVAAGQRLVVTANTLRAGENLTFNGAAETDGFFLTYGGLGTDILTGGQKDDGFFFGTGGRFGPSDRVDGQGGSFDQLGLQGDYTGANAVVFGADQLKSIEFIVALSGVDARFGSTGASYSYVLTTHNGNVAAGAAMVVSANSLGADETLTFNGSAEIDGRFRVFSGAGADIIIGGAGNDEISASGGNDRISGGLGADRLTGGEGADIFVYGSAAESTGLGFDTLIGFDHRVDRIDLPGSISSVAKRVETGTLSRASFDADLAAAVDGVIEPESATIFRPNAGDFAGREFLVVDADGDGMYRAGEDFVFEVSSPAAPIPALTEFFV